MKTLKAKLSLITLLAIGFGSVYAQEYDDMYFSANDRKQVKYVSDEKTVSQDLNEVEQITQDPSQNYSARTVNPEYIAKYQASSEERASAEFADDEYFVEDYNDTRNLNNVSSNYQNSNGIAVRDRFGNVSYFNSYSDVYWSDPFLYQGTMFDPLYRPYYRGYGNGYRPFRSGWSMSFGFGSGWYSGYSWNAGWGYGGYGYGYGYDPFYCPPYGYGGYYGYGYPNNTVIINNYENRNDRTYRRGPGPSRSGAINNNGRRSSRVASNGDGNDGRVSNNGRTAISNSSRARYISSSSDGRDYDNAQSKYYRRSRSAVNSGESTTSGRSYDNRSRSSSNYTPNTKSYSNSRSSVNRSSTNNNRSSYNSRSSNNSRTTNSSYSRPSNSRSNTYSPSRSSSPSRSNSSVGSSSRSRSSSSGVSRSSSSSRSSGSSRSSSGSSRRRGGN